MRAAVRGARMNEACVSVEKALCMSSRVFVERLICALAEKIQRPRIRIRINKSEILIS